MCVWTQLAGAGLTAPGNLEANLALPNSLFNFIHTRTNSAVLGTGSFVPTWKKKYCYPFLSACTDTATDGPEVGINMKLVAK